MPPPTNVTINYCLAVHVQRIIRYFYWLKNYLTTVYLPKILSRALSPVEVSKEKLRGDDLTPGISGPSVFTAFRKLFTAEDMLRY